jgi:uncharacterized protein
MQAAYDESTTTVPPPRLYLPQVYVLKIASRCNLDCSYCYMYNLADQTWRHQPPRMSEAVLREVARKIRRSGSPLASIIFHGGEPLLAGKDYLRRAVEIFDEDCARHGVKVSYGMQSNGTLLDEEWVDLLDELGINVGISLDGPADVHDRHRIFRNDRRGSHAEVARAIRLLTGSAKGRKVFGGVLCVVNLESDPLATYRHFVALGVKRLSFLPMDGCYKFPPPGKRFPYDDTPLADWLLPIFDEWFAGEERVTITLFEQIIQLLLGVRGAYVDFVSLYPKALCVVETDGGLEPVDSLKSVGDGFTKLGLNVLENEIEDLFSRDLIQLMQDTAGRLAAPCKACRVKHACGGGLLAHRYAEENGFDNPTIYCADMLKLIFHIERRVSESLSPRLVAEVQALAAGRRRRSR